MSDNAKSKGRRSIRYQTLDEVLADATRLSEVDAPTVGHWSQGQIYDHLAKSFVGSIDGMGFAVPAPMRFIFRLLMKNRMLNKSIPSGFGTKPHLEPPEVATEAGLADLREAVERLKTEEGRAPHPFFGNLTREEWDQFHLRHAELHMSFIVDP